MPNVLPQSQTPKSGGILFVNEPGVANFRALRVDVGNQHLYWQPTYQHLLRVEGAFGEFFPQAEFSDNGNRVVFTKHIEGIEVLGKTRALRPGERIPRREWLRFLTTWQSFKRLSERTDIPEDFRNFIIKFGPPFGGTLPGGIPDLPSALVLASPPLHPLGAGADRWRRFRQSFAGPGDFRGRCARGIRP